jgi:hypothetical protein
MNTKDPKNRGALKAKKAKRAKFNRVKRAWRVKFKEARERAMRKYRP